MKHFKLSVLLGLSAVLFTGCSGRVLEKDKIKEIKKVAIIGFDFQQQRAVSGSQLLGALMGAKANDGVEPALRVDSPDAVRAFDEFAQQLKTHFGWQVIPAKEMKANAKYIEIFKSKTEGFQNRPMVNKSFDLLTVAGVLDSFAILTLPKEIQKELQQALRVDSVVFVTLKGNLNNNSFLASMVGKGEFKPFVVTNVQVTDALRDHKVWVENVQGPEVAQGEKNTLGMTDAASLGNTYFQASKLSFESLFEKSRN